MLKQLLFAGKLSVVLALAAGCATSSRVRPSLPMVIPPQQPGRPTTRPFHPDRPATQLQGVQASSIPRDPSRDRLISLAIDGTVSDVVLALSRYGINVAVSPGVTGKHVVGVFRKQPIDSVLELVAASVGDNAEIYQRRGYVYIGQAQSNDAETAVFYVAEGTASDWIESYRIAGSGGAKTSVVGDKVIIQDSPLAIERIRRLHDVLNGARREYLLEVVFGELTDDEASALGLKVDLTGLSVLRVATGTAGSTDLALDAALRAVLSGSGSSSKSAKLNSTVLRVVEGSEASVQDGDTLNVAIRGLTESGVVVDVGTEKFDVGAILKARVSSLASGLVRLELEPEVSDVVSVAADGRPRTRRTAFKCSAYIGEGGVVVIGGITRRQGTDNADRFPGMKIQTGRSVQDSDRRLYVFLELHEVPALTPAGR